MIDLHCHILPGIDDGPETMTEAIAMCRMAAADGTGTIVATPHFKPGTHESTSRRIIEAVATLSEELKKRGIDIRILPGAEVAVSPEMHASLKPDGYLTINNGRYFLAEFSPLTVPDRWDTFLLSFLDAGMTPIVAHPERNTWFRRHPEALATAVHNGILLQITAMSITGSFGAEIQDFSVWLLKENLVHVIASDGHSSDFRQPKLTEAVTLAADVVGRQKAEALVDAIPQAIIEDRPIPRQEPIKYTPPAQIHRRSWLQRFGLANY
jgi:protein-tyrosine phosphatase